MGRRSIWAMGLAACGAAALLLAGCSGSGSLACASNQRYANSRTIGPWRIPDDLSAPKETGALQIPAVPGQNDAGSAAAGAGAPCLDSPPTFHEQDGQTAPRSRAAAPQGGSTEAGKRASRRGRDRDGG